MVLTTRPSGVNLVQTRSRSASETSTPTFSSASNTEATAPIAATQGTTPSTNGNVMAAALRLENFTGEQDIEQFLRRFEQYCQCLNIKNEQALAQLLWHLDGVARLFIESQHTMPTTVDELKTLLTNKFKKVKPVNLGIFNMKQEHCENAETFLSRLELETFKSQISDEYQVQIALNGLHPTISSAISTHAPKSLTEVKQLASRLTNIRYTAPVAAAQPTSLENTMNVLSTAVAQLTTVLAQRPNTIQQEPAEACSRCGGLPYRFVVIEFDDLLSAETEKLLIQADDTKQANCETSAWKRCRLDIYKCIDVLIGSLKSYRNTQSRRALDSRNTEPERTCAIGDTDDESAIHADTHIKDTTLWNKCDKNEIYLHLKDKMGDTSESTQSGTPKRENSRDIRCELGNTCGVLNAKLWTRFSDRYATVCQNLDSDIRPVCVVIDDNMYYRSMRYSYYQLAKKYNIGFCQVYIQTSVDKALVQNKQRENVRVFESTIKHMAERFEEPRPHQHIWEQNTLVLCNMPELNVTTYQNLYEFITQALSNPVEDTTEIQMKLANQSREICSANFLHQSDQILRKLVSMEMANAKEAETSKQGLKTLAESLQIVRKQISDNLKSGDIIVPQTIVAMTTEASKDESSDLFVFLKNCFDERTCKLKE